MRQIVLQFVFFPRFVVHQIVLHGLNYVENPCSCFFCPFSENEKSAVKQFVLFSSSELGPRSGRSQASLQNLEKY
jgi:hypothetical protein